MPCQRRIARKRKLGDIVRNFVNSIKIIGDPLIQSISHGNEINMLDILGFKKKKKEKKRGRSRS